MVWNIKEKSKHNSKASPPLLEKGLLGFWLHASEVKVKVAVMSDSLRPHGLYSPWNSSGQNTEVGSFFLLQGIFPTQG